MRVLYAGDEALYPVRIRRAARGWRAQIGDDVIRFLTHSLEHGRVVGDDIAVETVAAAADIHADPQPLARRPCMGEAVLRRYRADFDMPKAEPAELPDHRAGAVEASGKPQRIGKSQPHDSKRHNLDRHDFDGAEGTAHSRSDATRRSGYLPSA